MKCCFTILMWFSLVHQCHASSIEKYDFLETLMLVSAVFASYSTIDRKLVIPEILSVLDETATHQISPDHDDLYTKAVDIRESINSGIKGSSIIQHMIQQESMNPTVVMMGQEAGAENHCGGEGQGTAVSDHVFIEMAPGVNGANGVAGAGDGGEPPEPGSVVQLGEESHDDIKKILEEMKKEKNKLRPWNTPDKLKLLRKILTLSNKYPAYGKEFYDIARNILRYEKAGVFFMAGAGLSTYIGFALYNHLGYAVLRSILIISTETLTETLPIFISPSIKLDAYSVTLGSLVEVFGDNGFAYLSNGTYAMDFDSKEFGFFTLRSYLTSWLTVLIAKYGYAQFLIPKLSSIHAVNNKVLYAIAEPAQLAVIYLAVSLQTAGYPWISLTVAESPFGPGGKFPLPYYCPKYQWIPWFLGCNPNKEDSESGSGLPVLE